MKRFLYWCPYIPLVGLWIMEIYNLDGFRDTCIQYRRHWWISLSLHILTLAYLVYLIIQKQ